MRKAARPLRTETGSARVQH